ncbi:hypothetical protein CANARDRAFT_201190 [[Candida] arabinofermentans NRRL YB-2248]|uniref:Auxin efflux carrier n=1 Tax=[Candida] arabinofermentans NRRL YB-2248 TaxID=983967 RepID=A0A1E4SXU2_9ASCO|nr:hypothetical protein CANARDRAFT_201190 [[Candida] arabinofermentans NRRL YB-2248]
MSSSIELGSIIYIAVKPIFKIYMIIGVGFYLSRKNILSVDTSRNISTLAILVLIPCIAFTKIVTNIGNDDIAQIGTIVIVGFTIMLGGCLLTLIVGILTGCPKSWYGGLLSVGLLPNISDLPIAYIQSMENSGIFSNVDKGVSYICIFMVLQMFVQFNFGGFKLVEFDFRHAIRKAQRDAAAKALSSDEEEAAVDTSSTTTSFRNNQHDQLSQEHRRHDQVENSNLENHIDKELAADSSSKNDEHNQHMMFLQERNEAKNRRRTNSTNRRYSGTTSELARQQSIQNSIYSRDLRELPSQTMGDVVRLYSRFDELVTGDVQTEDPAEIKLHFKKLFTELTWLKVRNGFKAFFKMLFTATLKPVSITVIVSITICMIPWVKALFVVNSQATLPAAPDGQPPLSFIMDFTSYVANAQVPIGLLLLGGTIGRLEIKNLPKGVWTTPVAITIVRLCVFPVIGCALNHKIYKDGLFYGDDILYFVSNINFCLPPATSLIYITAFYTPVDSEDHIQIDCLALCYICHYVLLIVCLPITTSYTMKVSLGY